MQTETRAAQIEWLALAQLIAQLHLCLKTGQQWPLQNIFLLLRLFKYLILTIITFTFGNVRFRMDHYFVLLNLSLLAFSLELSKGLI